MVEFFAFVEAHVVSLLFSGLFITFIVQVLRMNIGNAEYNKFLLAHVIMKMDGTLDRKALRETLLFMASLYGFLHIVHKQPDLIINYFWAMSLTWLGKHVAEAKLPNLGTSTAPLANPLPKV